MVILDVKMPLRSLTILLLKLSVVVFIALLFAFLRGMADMLFGVM